MALVLEQAGDDLVAPAAGVAEHEQVVALALDVEAEANRVHCAAVDVGRVEFRLRVGGRETERCGVARGMQAFRRQRGGDGHERASRDSGSCAPS